jgi:hypothetical protein
MQKRTFSTHRRNGYFSLSHKRFDISYCGIDPIDRDRTGAPHRYDQRRLRIRRTYRSLYLTMWDRFGFMRQADLCELANPDRRIEDGITRTPRRKSARRPGRIRRLRKGDRRVRPPPGSRGPVFSGGSSCPGVSDLVWALHFRECSRELAVGPAAQDGGHAVTAGGPARYRMKQPSGQDTWRLRGRTRGHRRAPSRARPGRQRELDRPGQRFPSDPAVGLD